MLELEEAVGEAMKALKARGFESPYLRAFVVARINPIRFSRAANPDFDETIEKMIGVRDEVQGGERQAGAAREGGRSGGRGVDEVTGTGGGASLASSSPRTQALEGAS